MLATLMLATTTVNLRAHYGVKSALISQISTGWAVLLWGKPTTLPDSSVWWQCSAIDKNYTIQKGWIAEIAPNGAVLLQSPDCPKLSNPVGNGTLISQLYGENPTYYQRIISHGLPITAHNGIDFSLPVGSRLYAADNGIVLYANWSGNGFGNLIKVQSAWGQYIYAHLASFAVVPNQKVERGQIIGYSGNTGRSTGAHLHFGVRRRTPFNQLDGFVGYSDPLPMLPLEQISLPAYIQVKPFTEPVTNTPVTNTNAPTSLKSLSQAEILALLIYSEARGESEQGQIAVAHVVLNRVKRPCWWGHDIHSVILSPKQFSGFNNLKTIPPIPPQFIDLANRILSGQTSDPTNGSTHFYARWIQTPLWASKLTHTITIENHHFYQ
jgi:hypothetical protein